MRHEGTAATTRQNEEFPPRVPRKNVPQRSSSVKEGIEICGEESVGPTEVLGSAPRKRGHRAASSLSDSRHRRFGRKARRETAAKRIPRRAGTLAPAFALRRTVSAAPQRRDGGVGHQTLSGPGKTPPSQAPARATVRSASRSAYFRRGPVSLPEPTTQPSFPECGRPPAECPPVSCTPVKHGMAADAARALTARRGTAFGGKRENVVWAPAGSRVPTGSVSGQMLPAT